MDIADIPLNQSTIRNISSSEEINTSTELQNDYSNSDEDSVEKDEFQFEYSYCLTIDGFPKCEFENLETARTFMKFLLEKKMNDLEQIGQISKKNKDSEDKYTIIGQTSFLFLTYTYTLKTYEIFETIKINETDFEKV
jgi:hypothetical protein